MIDWKRKVADALDYAAFLERHGTADQRARWRAVEGEITLSGEQRRLLDGFVREMNVLCLAGAWCGDCVAQCPILEHFARHCPRIHLRFADRDAEAELAEELRVCGGGRVPVAIFLSEDFVECTRYGDRSLDRYRRLAREQIPGAAALVDAASELAPAEAVGDWLREFERVQWMLRLSPRLRRLHGD